MANPENQVTSANFNQKKSATDESALMAGSIPEKPHQSSASKPPGSGQNKPLVSLWRWFGHILIHLGSNILTFVLVLVVLLGMLMGSSSGRLWILESIVPHLFADTAYHLKIEGPSTNNVGQWSFQYLALLKNNEVVISANNLEFSVNLANLVTRRVDIKTVQADFLQIDVAAVSTLITDFSDAAGSTNEVVTSDPLSETLEHLLPVRVGKVNVKRVKVILADADNPDFSLEGNLKIAWRGDLLNGNIVVAALENGKANLRISGQLSDRLEGDFKLSVKEQEGGWLARLLKLPAKSPLLAKLHAEVSSTDDVWSIQIKNLAMPFQKHSIEALGALLIDRQNEVISFNGIELRVGSLLQRISGRISHDELALSAELNSFPVDITSFWQDEFKGGTLSGKITVTGTPEAPEAQAVLQLQTRYQGLPLEANTRFVADKEVIRLSRANGRLGELSLTGSGKVNLVKQTMDLKVTQARSPLRYLSLLKIAPIEDLNLDIDVADVHVTGSFMAPIYTGRANVSGSFKEQNFTASSVLRGDTKGITFKKFELFADSGRIAAQGLINWSREKLDLKIQAEDVPLAMLKLLEITIPDEIDLLISVKGGLKGSFQIPRFAGIASASGSYQDQSGRTAMNMSASLGADPKKITVHESHATLAFTADSPTHPQQSKSQQTTSVKAKGDFFPESQRIDVSMNFEALPLSVYQLFGLNIPYQAAGYFAGDLHISGLLSEPTIAGELIGSGSFENSPFSVEIEGAGSRDNFIIKAAKASWGEARCSGKGQYQEGIADFSVSLNEFNLENLTVFGIETIPVELNLDFAVKGSFDDPFLRGKVRLTHWVADQNNPDKTIRLDWNSDVVLEREVLTVQSALLSNEKAQGNIEFAFPWYDYLHRLQQASNFVRADMPVTASARGWLDLDWIEYFIDQDDHQFGGVIDIDLITSGVLGDPNVTGVVGLKSGVYKNQVSRTSIEKGEMEILFAGRRLDVATGKASDGDGGRILVQGFIDWSHNALTGQLGDVAIDITTKSIQLVRRDELEGEASGKLTVTGDFHRLLVNGEVEVSPLRVVLDLLNDSSIPELELVALEDSTTETAEDVIFSMPEINLNVVMKASRKAFVSGRGLNAELEGMVRIVGSLDNTDYRGRFAIVRGTFDLFGKRFNLEEGDMLFENDTISIYVEGRHSDSEYEYLVTISGGLNDLKIELSTVPDLPQDEAISRLLFGKSVRGITPFQAVRLAQAVQELRGKSSGFDPISTTRNILQLDNLTVDSAKTDNGSGVTVGVGKYINERVYVELERSADAAQPWQGSIEVELKPKLVLEGSTDDIGGASVDLKWKYDY